MLATAIKACVAAVLTLTVSAGPATLHKVTPPKKAAVTLDGQLAALTRDTVAALKPVGRSAMTGNWKNSSGCWRCDAGPALAMAASGAATKDTALQTSAATIFDAMVAAHPTAGDIDTMFFDSELGIATVLLKPNLSKARLASWTAAVTRGADFLSTNKNLSWYTNGNIVIGNTLVMALAFRLTGLQKYSDAYETALQFAANPPQQRWPGFGFKTVKAPTSATGADGKGYFTETGIDGPGYDPEYTMLQLDQLSRIYLINGDQRIRWYMNMVLGQLMDRVDTAAWTLDTSGGTRKTQAGRKIVFDTAGLVTLSNVGGRTDLVRYLTTQRAAMENEFRGSFADFGDRHKYAVGMIVASTITSEPGNAALR